MRGATSFLVVAGLLVAAACGGGSESDRLVVSAAASLTDAFMAIAAGFEQQHPAVDVVLNFGGSAALREQILEGASIDVFASAGTPVMDQLVAAGVTASPPVVFARNAMTIAVPLGNPADVTGLEDLADPERFVGLCAAGVPCGDFARQILSAAGVVASVDTEEGDVRALVAKIAAGELDAGIVYRSDIVAQPEVAEVPIPDVGNVAVDYPIAVLAGAAQPEAAAAFVTFVTSAAGAAILDDYGFTPP